MPKKRRKWVIRLDGCWLAAYADMGIREVVQGVTLDVPTGVYTDDMRYALPFDSRGAAEALAKRLGAKIYEAEGPFAEAQA